MSRAAPIGVAIAIGALTAACDPIMHMNGVVHTVPENPASAVEAPYAGGTPIAGAQITMTCPGAEPVEIAVADDDGRVSHGTVGMWRTECVLEVEAPDYHPQSFSIDDLCVVRSGSSCHFIAIYAELPPRTPPGSSDDAASPPVEPPPEVGHE